jgi:predicted ATP-dependent protease
MRRNLSEDKVREMIERDVLMIDTQGFKIGQVNGLSVYDMGDYAFGKPSRITAQTAVGRSGIVNIEREVELSGPTHDKGVLILTAFLQHAFSQNKALALSASLCFETIYNEVDATALPQPSSMRCCSRLAKVPIDQGLAVTGFDQSKRRNPCRSAASTKN